MIISTQAGAQAPVLAFVVPPSVRRFVIESGTTSHRAVGCVSNRSAEIEKSLVKVDLRE